MSGASAALCMIVKNEAANLADCLASAKDLVDEVVVVDTGSADGTDLSAERLGARVFGLPWQNDFAAARNAAIDQARSDWVLILDADERLAQGAAAELRSFLRSEQAAWTSACALTVVSYLEDGNPANCEVCHNIRLFRNLPGHRYRGRIHEQILTSIREASPSLNVVYLPAKVLHYGYMADRAAARSKAERNLQLIQEALASDPNDLHMQYHAGICRFNLGQLNEAIAHLSRAAGEGDKTLNYQARACKVWGMAMLRLGRPQEALEILDQFQRYWPAYTDLEYVRATAHKDLRDYSRAMESLARCIAMGPSPPPYDSHPGLATYRAALMAGELASLLGDVSEAEAFLRRVEPGEPGFLSARAKLLGLYEARLGRSRALQRMSDELPAKARCEPMAEICLLAGMPHEAQSYLSRTPRRDPVRHDLIAGRSLFAAGRAREGAQALARVPAGSSLWDEAQAWRCCCALALHDEALLELVAAACPGPNTACRSLVASSRYLLDENALPAHEADVDLETLLSLVVMMEPYPDPRLLQRAAQAFARAGAGPHALKLSAALLNLFSCPDLAWQAYQAAAAGGASDPDLLARILAGLGRHEEALQVCSAAHASGKALPDTYLLASKLFARMAGKTARLVGGCR
ncbi:MAG: glycosyltransferase [Bacillota bacterium]|nr:glycosyltransferase [Bacillota bacterium]